MVFSDLFFLFAFLPSFLLLYILGGTTRIRNVVLILFSLIFYAWGEPVYVLLMIGSSVLNYLCGLLIAGKDDRRRKSALILGIIINILILATFKYLGFIVANLTCMDIYLDVPPIALPIGISFYTFQSISYLVDVYRNEAQVQKHYGNLLLYISMFPQLIAGPIVRYGTIAKEIGDRRATAEDLAEGIYRFIIGLGKKVIIANQLSEISSQFLSDSLSHLTTYGAWIGLVAFTLQIYFDFSGYSDMAIGLGRCMGFHFNENFRHPYCCDTITDFWRRWHISLGSFFRDYIYIPLGGNRKHQPINILLVWFLTGMWHGASWNFIIWGLYFGILLMVEKWTVLKVKDWIPIPIRHIVAILLVTIGWGIFYFESFSDMLWFFDTLFCHPQITGGRLFILVYEGYDFAAVSALTDNFWLWVTAVLFCMPLRHWTGLLVQWITPSKSFLQHSLILAGRLMVSIVLLTLSVALLVGATNNAFIYTRF